jgi:hypothetical protein
MKNVVNIYVWYIYIYMYHFSLSNFEVLFIKRKYIIENFVLRRKAPSQDLIYTGVIKQNFI